MNNKNFDRFLFLLSFCAALIHSGLAIQCYQCSSLRDNRCRDPISEEMKPMECTQESVTTTMTEISYAIRGRSSFGDVFSGSPITCLKISTPYSTQQSNMTYIRGCYYDIVDGKDICTVLKDKMIDQRNFLYCGTCMGDACNGATSKESIVSIFTLFFSVCAFYAISH